MNARRPAPPRIARALLQLFCAQARREEVLGDFDEAYASWVTRQGSAYAGARYWKEVLQYGGWRTFGRFRRAGPARTRPRAARRPEWMADLGRDTRYGLQSLARAPGFAAIAIVILALGIGANAMMFTLVNDLFFQPPEMVQAPEELVRFDRVRSSGVTSSYGYADYAFYRDNNDAFSGVLAYDASPATVAVGNAEDGEVSQASVGVVSSNYFDVLGVQPEVGRTFVEEEGRTPLTHPVVVLSHGFWRRHFGSRDDAVGSTLRLNGRAFSVVGVVPRDSRGVSPVEPPTDLYIPIMMQGAVSPGAEEMLVLTDGSISFWLTVVGRMRPDVDLESAQANMDVVRARFLREYASWVEATEPNPFRVELSRDFQLAPQFRSSLAQLATILFAVVGTVLLIASVNLALLLLARASVRHRELGIRMALGAGRSRVVRQLIAENSVLAGPAVHWWRSSGPKAARGKWSTRGCSTGTPGCGMRS